MNNDNLTQGLKDFENREVVEQSLALVDIVKDLLDTTKKHLNKVYIALIVSILSNLIIIGAFLWYESQWEYETTTETTTTTEQVIDQKVSGENSKINNVEGDQYNDSATHNDSRPNQE